MNPQIESLRNNLSKLETFFDEHPSSLPAEEGLYTVSIDPFPMITVWANKAPNTDGLARILAAVGQDWGRDGWEKEADYYQREYTWEKDFDGVHLRIHEAEKIPRIEKQKVPPTAFPLQILDRAAA